MAVASPWWLLGLLPWAAVVVWLLIGRGESAAVPFLNLWQAPNPMPRTSRARLRWPSLGVALCLVATLLAVVAAAHPLVPLLSHRASLKITIVADHRMTIAKWNDLVELADRSLREQFTAGPVDLIDSDGKWVETDLQSWAALARQSAISSDDRKVQIVGLAREILSRSGLIILLSDQQFEIDDPAFIQFAPEQSPKNAGFTRVSARSTPWPAVMMSIRNDSDLSAAQLQVANILRPIELPPHGQSRNYFIELKELPSVLPVELVADDDLPLDNHARLVQERAWPRIEVASDVPSPLVRMIDTYSKLRVPSESSARLVVSSETIATEPTVIVAASNQTLAQGEPRAIDHPINANLDWSKIIRQGIRVSAAPRQGWQTIAWAGDSPLVAVRENPVRQVWVGVDSDAFSRSTDFVVFWTNVFDWAGQGGDRYVFQGTAAVPIPTWFKTNWKQKLKSLPFSFQAVSDFSAPFSMTALILVWAASMVWKRGSQVS
ncbi:MAG TPA: hypothetical protein VHD56_01745 [Tepidisphaeraceae bacterium]|nr:hypothetical protein [Tepidisphaeraceae bacterium]